MFAKLTGVVDAVYDDWFILDVGGVGYRVSASRKTLDLLERSLGHTSVPNAQTSSSQTLPSQTLPSQTTPAKAVEKTSFMIETQVREDAITLFGFLSLNDQKVFRLLLSVQGVGAKVALAVQSVLTAEQIKIALSAGDKGAISRATGVGPKLAQRIINELKDKAVHLSLTRASGFGVGRPNSEGASEVATEPENIGSENRAGGSGSKMTALQAAGDDHSSLTDQEGQPDREPQGIAGLSMLDAITSALINLGYRPMEAQGAAARAIQSGGEDADLRQLVPKALRELSQDVGR